MDLCEKKKFVNLITTLYVDSYKINWKKKNVLNLVQLESNTIKGSEHINTPR